MMLCDSIVRATPSPSPPYEKEGNNGTDHGANQEVCRSSKCYKRRMQAFMVKWYGRVGMALHMQGQQARVRSTFIANPATRTRYHGF